MADYRLDNTEYGLHCTPFFPAGAGSCVLLTGLYLIVNHLMVKRLLHMNMAIGDVHPSVMCCTFLCDQLEHFHSAFVFVYFILQPPLVSLL